MSSEIEGATSAARVGQHRGEYDSVATNEVVMGEVWNSAARRLGATALR